MVTNKENLFKLGKKITDRIPYKLGFQKVNEECPEYKGFVNVLNDEMVEVTDGLNEGDVVVWDDTTELTEGMDVKVK